MVMQIDETRRCASRACSFAVTFFCLAASAAFAAESPASQPVLPVLHLFKDGFVAGTLRDSSGGKVIRWQSPLFTTPFEFSLADISDLQFPPPAKTSRPVGDFCFELECGDVLIASLTGQTEHELTVDIAKIGHV